MIHNNSHLIRQHAFEFDCVQWCVMKEENKQENKQDLEEDEQKRK
jgi:hypothetical protein